MTPDSSGQNYGSGMLATATLLTGSELASFTSALLATPIQSMTVLGDPGAHMGAPQHSVEALTHAQPQALEATPRLCWRTCRSIPLH